MHSSLEYFLHMAGLLTAHAPFGGDLLNRAHNKDRVDSNKEETEVIYRA